MRLSKVGARMIGAAVGLFVDRLLGEPPAKVHPVSNFGNLMNGLENFIWQDNSVSGFWYVLIGLAAGLVFSEPVGSPFFGTVVGTYIAVAEKSLIENGMSVMTSLESGDLYEARVKLQALVGRDTSGLDEGEISRAAIESIAENSSDAVIAPMLYGALFGGRGAVLYRAINTMDAMVGHKSATYFRFGRVAARLDDFGNFFPSRIAAALAWLVPSGMRPSITSILSDAAGHPSPNAGVVESTYAHKLGLTLGGKNFYRGIPEERARMGSGCRPEAIDVSNAAQLCKFSDTIFAGFLLVAGLLISIYARGRENA